MLFFFNVAEGPDPAKSFCPTGYKCCHQDNIQAEAEADPTEQCSSNVFGKCVSKERCAKNIETFTKKTCDQDGEVCCSKKWVKPDEKPCQNSCVADDRCLDSNDVLKDAGKCSGTDVCCQNVAPEYVFFLLCSFEKKFTTFINQKFGFIMWSF